jgi:hypothetical protein
MREKSFQTAAARRRKDPIVWHIDDTTVRLKASIELADIADALHEIQQPMPEGSNQIQIAAEKRMLLVQALSGFIVPEDAEAFLAIQQDLDFGLLSEMLNEAIVEYTGAGNPTLESSSSDGS